MTVKEAASKLDMPVWRVWKLCTTGAIPFWRAEGCMFMDPDDVFEFARTYPGAA
jgi:hypothetical protein